MEFVEARVIDEKHLKLVRPIDVSAGSRVMVSVIPIDNIAEENDDWLQLAVQGLAAAYDEAEYSVQLIKRSNPEFRP